MEQVFEGSITELVELCRYASPHPRFVQGGGGNCSVKAGITMAVKASGYFLQDISPQAGIAFVDLKTGLAVPGSAEKPSMESPLHHLLGTYVIHTHPIAVAALVCAKEGKRAFETLFPGREYAWVDYAAPGKKLFEKVKETLSEKAGDSETRVLFLKNHGLFAAAAAKDECIALHEKVIKILERFFGGPFSGGDRAIPEGCFLTPDHAVYTGCSGGDRPPGQPAPRERRGGKIDSLPLSKKQIQAITEIRQFAREVLAILQAKKWEPDWLSGRDAQEVLNMDEEKYRQTLWRKPA